MKKKIKNIAVTLFILALATPMAIKADDNDAVTTDIEIPAVYHTSKSAGALLALDDEALRELAEMGIDMADNSDELAGHIIEYATTYLGRPYRSGGKGPTAFDCSGFTSYVFKQYGIDLNASSSAQYTQGQTISKDEIRPGDLLFFGGRRGGKTVGHVALAVDVDSLGTIHFIHAAQRGGIRYDTYPDGGYYSQRYIGARRVIE